MKFQPASIYELKRLSIGSAICLSLMIAVFFLLSLVGVGNFGVGIILSGGVGTLIAIANFAILCLTIQNAAQLEDKKQIKARFQISYNGRLIFQAAWVVAAFLLSSLNMIAATVPLLFPAIVIFFLHSRGK